MNEKQQRTRSLRSEFLMRIEVEFEDPVQLGEVPLGTRRILYVRAGSFAGPRLSGEVLPGGGDWVLGRRDGVFLLDIRMALCVPHGGLIALNSSGMLDIRPELRERIARGEEVGAELYYFRTTATFETARPELVWLNRLIAIGVGKRTFRGMSTDVFIIR